MARRQSLVNLWGFELMALLGEYLSRATLRSLWGVLSLLPAQRGIYPGTRPTDANPWQSQNRDDPYIHPCANFDLYRADDWKLGLGSEDTKNLQRALDATRDYYARLYKAHRDLDQEQRNKMVVIAGVGYKTLFRLAYAPCFLGLWETTEKVFQREGSDPHREGDGRVPLASALLENVGDNHFTAELGHRLKLSAASRRDAPASTASITRSRKSSEYGFGIAWTPKRRISAVRLAPQRPLGNPFDLTQPENALGTVDIHLSQIMAPTRNSMDANESAVFS